MVGVPRSKGCRICVQRRVKCDQTRPTCNNCKKGNRPCPGYGQDLKFQDEGVRLRKRFEHSGNGTFSDPTECSPAPFDSQPDALEGNASRSSSGISTPAIESGTGITPIGQDSKHWDVVGLDMNLTERRTFLGLLEGKTEAYAQLVDMMPEFSEVRFQGNINNHGVASLFERLGFPNYGRSSHPFFGHLNSAEQNQNALISTFKHSLFPDDDTIPQQFRNHARWLSHLPPLTGTNPLLDASVRAVTLVHIGRLNNSEPFVMESRPYYGQALRLLNKALQSKSSGMSNETLCAVILLSFYEMFASDNNESWIRHAGGVSALMRARGPARHRHGFDREIFLAYRYTLIIEAFQEDVPCFLAEPAWIELSHNIHEDLKAAGVAPSRIEIFDLAEEYYACMVKLPELCAQARAWWQAKQSNTPPPYNRAVLIDKLSTARAAFKGTFTRFEAAFKKAGHAPTINLNQRDPLIGIEYEFVNTFVSATYTGYWTILIVLNLCLQGLHIDDAEMVLLYHTESRECSLNICRSSTYMLKSSFLGPFFLIFGLRVGLLVFEDAPEQETSPEADWILHKLFEIGDHHMGMAKHVPGYRAGITVDELIAEFRARRAKSKQSSDVSEQMEFNRQVTHGGISEASPNFSNATHGSVSTAYTGEGVPQWQAFSQVEDVLKAWDDQDNFELQTDMLGLGASGNERSRSSTRSPQPDASSQERQQRFAFAAASIAMPDMSFFDPRFAAQDVRLPQPTADNFLDAEQQGIQRAMSSSGGDQSELEAEQSVPLPRRRNSLPRGLERFFTE